MKGRVLIVGGSEDFVGAPYLAGIAAMRSGAESVIVMAPAKVAWAINTLSPDLMTRKLPGAYLSSAHASAILRQLKTADVLVIGNGAGTRRGTASLMRTLMKWPGPKVVDADALKVLRGNSVKKAVLTPNEGEWRLIAAHNDLKKLVATNVIVRKGRKTEILSGRKRYAFARIESGLRKAGTGDVLAGLIAGNLARGLSAFAASKKACAEGNRVARVLKKKNRHGDFLASDIARGLKKLRILSS